MQVILHLIVNLINHHQWEKRKSPGNEMLIKSLIRYIRFNVFKGASDSWNRKFLVSFDNTFFNFQNKNTSFDDILLGEPLAKKQRLDVTKADSRSSSRSGSPVNTDVKVKDKKVKRSKKLKHQS